MPGALDEEDYIARLERAGFTGATVTPTRIYGEADVRQLLSGQEIKAGEVAAVADKFMSAFIEA